MQKKRYFLRNPRKKALKSNFSKPFSLFSDIFYLYFNVKIEFIVLEAILLRQARAAAVRADTADLVIKEEEGCLCGDKLKIVRCRFKHFGGEMQSRSEERR